MLVKNIYNRVAILTGFPQYTNDTDTPDITRTLLEYISQGLQNVIDSIYIQNNVLERVDTITVSKGQDEIGIEGLIKKAQLISSGRTYDLPYLEGFDKDTYFTEEERSKHTGKPRGFVIRKGYLRLFPIPDNEYTLKVVLSTTDLVSSNSDVYKIYVDDVNDTILADNKFCELVALRASILLLARANNASAQILNELYVKRLNNYLEHDLKTTQANRFFDRSAGHFRLDKGLLG